MEIKFTNVLLFYKKEFLAFIMRSFIFLFCAVAFGFTPEDGFSQNAKIVINSDKTVSVDEVFDLIKTQTDYTFIFRSDLFKNAPKVVLKKGIIQLKKLLEKSLSEGNYKYVFSSDNQIVLSEKNAHLKSNINSNIVITISGKVIDKKGEPLPGVNIIEKGTKNGVASNFEGIYTINVTNEASILEFSYMGYITKDIVVGSITTINVVLLPASIRLEEVEVVYSTGYQKIAKERATGAATFIKGADISRQITTNIVDRLEGITPGLLTTTENGDFGDEVKLTLRGQGTFEADDQPLIVVDGFPIEGSLNSINPNDVESMTILKDAAAASIWGTRAGNGVVVITTKRGKVGKPQFEYSTAYSLEIKPDLNRLQIANSDAQIEFYSYDILSGKDDTYESALVGGNSALNLVQQAYFNNANGLITNEQLAAQLNILGQINSFNQYDKYLLRDAAKTQHNVSVKGGSETNRYYASLTYNGDDSKLVGDDDERINLNLKNDINFSDKLRLDIGLNATFNSSNRNSEGLGLISGTPGDGQTLSRFQNLVDPITGERLDIPRDFNSETKSNYEGLGYLDWGYNPISEAEDRDVSAKDFTLRLQGGLEWDITKDLNWRISGMYERRTTNRRNQNSLNTYEARHNINFFTLSDPNSGKLTYQVPFGGILRKENIETRAYTLRTQIGLDKVISEKHRVVAVAGIEARQIANNASSSTLLGYDDDLQLFSTTVNWALLDRNTPRFDGGTWAGGFKDRSYVSEGKNRFISFFGNASYTFDKRYTVTASAKIEQASVFGLSAKLRANKLWSIGTGWNIDEEDFFNFDFVNTLKLRASYGVNGNIKRGLTTETVLIGKTSTAFQIPYLDISIVGNPELTHEDNFVTNIGLDFRLFNRLNGSIDYYNRKSENLLSSFQVSSTYGILSQFFNNGEITNKGVEISLGGDILRSGDFYYNANLNFTYNKGEVLKFDDRAGTAEQLIANVEYHVGEDPGAIFAYEWAGLSEDGAPQVYDENGVATLWNVDIDNKDAAKVYGTQIPPYFGSLNNLFGYKGFSLGVFLTYKIGHKFIAPSYYFGSSQIHEDITKRWRNPGDENTTDIARFPTVDEQNNSNFNNWNNYYRRSNTVIEDASFIRIRDISFNYDLGKKLLEKIPFDGIRLTAQVRNLGFLWKATDLDIDPDILPLSGGFIGETVAASLITSRPGTPAEPIYSLGLRLNF